MNRLPEVPDGRREILVMRSQRNMYDRALTLAGGRIVEIGIPDRFSGPGVRDAAAWEIEYAIGPQTAAIYYLAQPQSRPSLRDVVAVARSHGIPMLVDAAAQLPPACNLRRFIEEGADIVCFSGGKAIGGPQSSGILCGRADLVASALIQMLDLDIEPERWSPPAEFSALAQLRGLPHHGIGRSCKVGKEEIAGLLVALRRFAAAGPAARREGWRSLLQIVIDTAGGKGMRILSGPVPMLEVQDDGAATLAEKLAAGTPAIACNTARASEGILLFNPLALTEAEARQIGERLRALR
jgi:L-seryl-tRNA(Ser) seleniumtransferase